MKLWIPMLILTLAVSALCIWDTIHINKVFTTLETKSEYIYQALQQEDITNEKIQKEILNLNEYWTKKMDTLCISISRKDLQPVSDYLQYLCASITNNNQDDAITYSRLLNYNIVGLGETNGVSFVNLLWLQKRIKTKKAKNKNKNQNNNQT